MKMKLFRTVGIVLALCMGWYAAGLQDSRASGDGHDHSKHGHTQNDAASNTAGDDHHAGHAGDAAKLLKPQPGDAPWYSSMLLIAGGLFVAAIVIGYPAMKIKGPEPADPADDHHDDHDGHGHDDDGHGDDHAKDGHGH